MILDPARLRTVRQFAEEAQAFPQTYLRWLISNAEHNGFDACFVRIAGKVLIDPMAVTTWLAQQQAHPQPHNRGIARKRLAQIDPNFDAVGEAIREAEAEADAPETPEPIPETKEPPSNLPPGFRAKKK